MEINRPLVSILIAINKDDGYFDEAVKSIIDQSYTNLEIIIVANNCSEFLWKKILTYKEIDSRIIPYRIKLGGLAFALNYGIEKANGIYIARMDADDISCIDRIKKQVEFMLSHSEISILGTQIQYIDKHSKEIQKGRTKVPLKHNDIVNFLKMRCPFWHPTVMFEKERIIEIGGYRYGMYGEDYDLWIRAYIAGLKFENLNEVYLKYRTHGNQMSSNNSKYSIVALLFYYFKKTNDIAFFKGCLLYTNLLQFIIIRTTKLRKYLKGDYS